MSSPLAVILAELPLLAEVESNETWLEGERRGCYVPRTDPAVQARVGEIVFENGEKWRKEAEK